MLCNGGSGYSDEKNGRDIQLMLVAAGSILGVVPFNFLYAKYGARFVLFAAGLTSLAMTALIPFGLSVGFWFFCVFSSVRRALAGRLFTTYLPEFRLPCSLRISYFYNDHPEKVSFVSSDELGNINRGKSQAHIDGDTSVPYKAIMTNKVILVVWVNAFFDQLAGMFFITYLPEYLNKALGFPVRETGILNFVAILHIPTKLLVGYASDKIKCASERSKMIVCNCISVGSVGIVFVLIGVLPDTTPRWILTMFVL
ncbi:protein T22F3.11 [Aphelenchoides avenae]|nr:protein T22F3.11 [Aphelenchus avenae]